MSEFSEGRRANDIKPSSVLDQFDPLTGLATREFYQQRIAEAWDQAQLEKTQMSLMLIAVDGVDRDTDISSELEDQLKEIANVLSSTCQRRSDFAARMRASEFAVYLTEVDQGGALDRAQVVSQRVKHETGLYVSVGVVTLVPNPRYFVTSLYQAADKALRAAQDLGPGQVKAYSESEF